MEIDPKPHGFSMVTLVVAVVDSGFLLEVLASKHHVVRLSGQCVSVGQLLLFIVRTECVRDGL